MKNHKNQLKQRARFEAWVVGLRQTLPGISDDAAWELFQTAKKPRTEPEQRGADDSTDDRETPPDMFGPLNAEFGPFTLDVAAAHHNALCPKYCTLEGTFQLDPITGQPERMGTGTGLTFPWAGHRVWDNPPFSDLLRFLERHWDESSCPTSVAIIPNNRSEQPFWQRLVEPFRDRAGSPLLTRNLQRRRQFNHQGAGIGNKTSKNPPFGITVLIWDRRDPREKKTWEHQAEKKTG